MQQPAALACPPAASGRFASGYGYAARKDRRAHACRAATSPRVASRRAKPVARLYASRAGIGGMRPRSHLRKRGVWTQQPVAAKPSNLACRPAHRRSLDRLARGHRLERPKHTRAGKRPERSKRWASLIFWATDSAVSAQPARLRGRYRSRVECV